MGDAQSAPREGEEDAADGDDAPTEQNIDDKPLRNKGQNSEINGKADSSKAEVNGHCEDEITAKAVLSADEDVSQTEMPFKEETLLENSEINEKGSPNEADANENIPLEVTEMNAKQNDINESFRRFFSNIGLKLTVKRGSGEIPKDLPNDTNREEPNRPDKVEDTTKEITSENTYVNMAQETWDNDSTTCPTLTDVTSEEVLENVEGKEVETKEKVESDNGNAAMASPPEEDTNQDTTTEEKPLSTSLSSPEEAVVVVSPVKRFFTTGLFSGLRKKKKPAEDETIDKEMNDTGKKEVVQKKDETVLDQQEDKEDTGVDAAAVETEHENEEQELKREILSTAQPMDASTDSSSILVTAPELLRSQEKDKVQGSPIKRLLLGSNLKKLSKKQRSRRSSDATSCNSGDHESDQLLSSTEKAEGQKEEGSVQPSKETAGEDEGAWASFKKLVTPKKRIQKCFVSSEGTRIPDSAEEQKPSEGGQMSDHSTEEGKKRKDSSVSWESVLCRSGRRRSRKTSDSDDETPQIKNDLNKPGGGSKLDVNNEVDEMFVHCSKQAKGSSDGSGASTWQSLKRLITPKRKAKGEDECKDSVQSDSEVTQDESSLSVERKRKKRKSVKKQDEVSSDETDEEAASGEEDSDTPAVVPLSEFDTDETEVCIQQHAEKESLLLKEADSEIHQDLPDPKAVPVLPCDNLKIEEKKVQGNNAASENQATTTRATDEEPDDLTESISKQQLSDIPEEATAASVTEEAAREDTVADDLIEITSEAITATENLDITLADETEMISAVSQLSSESSKTSGNTTPVPAQHAVEETDGLLYQVVETISASPEAVPVCSCELRPEGTAFYVSHQILETFVKEEPTILELHRSRDTTEIDRVLKLVELDERTECEDTTQIESICEVNYFSTDILSELPTEEFNTTEMTEDEVEEVDVAHPEYSVTELEDVEENINKLAEAEKIVVDEGSLVVENQTETEPPKIDSQEADFAATVADDIKDGRIEQEAQSEDDNQQPVEVEYLAELANVQTLKSLKKDIISEAIPAGETLENKLKEELQTYTVQPVHVAEAPEAEKASTLDPDEGSLHSPTEEVKPEDILPAETVTDEPNLEVERLTEVNVDPENQEGQVNLMKTVVRQVPSDIVPEGETDEPQKETMLLLETNLESVDASTTGQEQEVLKAVHATEIASKKGSEQSFEKEATSVSEGETGTDEPKHSAQVLTEVSVEPENDELHVIGMKTVPEIEVCQAVRAPKPCSEEDSVQSLEEEFIPLNVPEGDADEPKEETTRLHEANLYPVDASKTEHVQESEVFEAVQQTRLDSEEVSVSSEREKTNSEETVPAEPEQSAEVRPEVSVEPENEELPANDIEMVPVAETSEVIQAPMLDSEDGVQSLDKEVVSEIVSGVPNEGTIYLSEDIVVPVDAYQTEHVKEPQAPEAVPGPTLDSEEGSMQSPNEEVQSEDISTAETVSDEPKESAQVHPEVSVEPQNQELVTVMETIHATEVSEAVQAPTLDLEEGVAQSLEIDIVILLNLAEEETVSNDPNEIEKHLTEVCVQLSDAFKTEQAQEPEVIQSVRAAARDSEERSVQSLEEKLLTEDVTEGETVTDEPKQEAFPLTEDNLELLDASTTGQAEPAAPLDLEGTVLHSPEKEEIPEDIPVVETITEEPEEENEIEPEKIPAEASETERAQEPEALASDVTDCAPETKVVAGTSTCMQVVTESMEGGASLELEKAISLDDVPIQDIGSVGASVALEGVAPPGPSLEKAEARDTGMGQEDHIPIIADKLLTLTADCVYAGKEEAGNQVQVLEKTVLTKDAAVTNEPKHIEHPSTAQAAVEGPKEGERSSTEVESAPIEHAVAAQVVVCNIKDVLVAIPDIVIEKTSPITEPLREIVTRELMSKEHVESSALLVPEQKAEAAEGRSAVVTMHVPSVELEDNHRIQVQVVGDDIKSAESSVDAVLEVGTTRVKEVIDACRADVEKVNDVYATPRIEEGFINEHDQVTVEGVILHAKENLPEKEAESTGDYSGQEGAEQPDAVREESETVESESAHSLERQEETSTVVRDVAATGQRGAEDLVLTADIPARAGVPMHPQRDESEETKVEEHKEAQTIQTLIVTPANTEVISSIGNVDSSSSLSIELKVNINLGHANKPSSPPPTTEGSGPANKADASDVVVQAVEVEPVKTTKHMGLAGAAVPGTANTEPAENMDPQERSGIATQPVLLHISIQAIEAEEQMKSPETVTSSVRDADTKPPVRQTETTEGFPTHTVPSEAGEPPTEAKTPAKQKEEDQDVWMDAEEDVHTQEKAEACRLQVEDPLREAQAGLEHVVDMTEEEESQQKLLKTAERCGTDSESEDFVFAAEHPEIETARLTTME
ncbi:uncharacterized protein akap12a isoform 1-T2 [Spinachia spinachia]